MPIILYKNSARVGAFVNCAITVKSDVQACSVEECVKKYDEKDCILPWNVSSTELVYPCFLRLRVCNDNGDPRTDAIQSLSPELYLRTDRGAWSVFHEHSLYLLPKHDFFLQIATKERSNILRAALAIEFCFNETVIATSEIILVLSKPPILHKNHPFARIMQASKAKELGFTGNHCKPSRWMKCLGEENLIIPEFSSSTISPCTIHSLGAYRTIPEVSLKRARHETSEELEELRTELLEMKEKIHAIEHEKLGLVKALRLLAQD